MISETGTTEFRRKARVSIDLKDIPAVHNEDAEKAVLGAMMSAPESVIDMVQEDGVTSEHFFTPAHQSIYTSLVEMRDGQVPIDTLSLANYLKDRKLLEGVGGAAYLAELATSVINTFTVGGHAKTLRDKHTLRRLQEACGKIVYNVQQRQHEADIVIDEAEQDIFQIRHQALRSSIQNAKQVVAKTLKIIESLSKRSKNRLAYSGIPSGFEALDRLTTGFKPGEMIVIAARPGVGKTALALSMMKNFIREKYDEDSDSMHKPGYGVGIFSLEMTTEQLMMRIMASVANLSMGDIREGKLSTSDISALTAVSEEISAAPIYFDEASMLSISQLRAKARRMKQYNKVDIIIIDYLQLLTSSSEKSKDSRQVEVSEISRGIKALAMELEIPIIVLAQLNRKPEDSKTGEPELHHLRESGSIEQDADVVMLLSKVEKDGKPEIIPNMQGFPVKMLLRIAKQRNGPTDDIALMFQGAYTRFDNMPREAH